MKTQDNTKYQKYRWFFTSSSKIVIGGKNANQNEEIVGQAGEQEYVLHTALPGSPFVNIKDDSKRVSKQELKQAAVFCAKYSQAWKKSKVKGDIEVGVFLGKDIFKEALMKTGTFGVKKAKNIIVKKAEIRSFIENKKETD